MRVCVHYDSILFKISITRLVLFRFLPSVLFIDDVVFKWGKKWKVVKDNYIPVKYEAEMFVVGRARRFLVWQDPFLFH
jgi:hypothetical protein